MAKVLGSLFFLLFLSIVTQGYCQCSGTVDLLLSQAQTGNEIQGKPEWEVTISNKCFCNQGEIKLSCPGFQTAEAIDPSILAKTGDECLVNNGQYVGPKGTFSFKYAWDTQFPFQILFSTIACSK